MYYGVEHTVIDDILGLFGYLSSKFQFTNKDGNKIIYLLAFYAF